MKNTGARIVLVLLTAFLFHICSQKTHASIYSYKLFSPMIVKQPDMVAGGRVAWWTEYPFDVGIMNHGGKMILSKNPDGTGDAFVGDTLQVIANNPAHGSYIFTYNAHRPNCFFEDPPAMPPQDITSYFPVQHDPYDVTVRILDWCGKDKTTDSLYLVNITNEPDPMPTPTTTPAASITTAPTPTPSLPAPTQTPKTPRFLDLPWDYTSKGLSFTDVALKIESYFDHQYPLLSSKILEPPEVSRSVIRFDSAVQTEDNYSSHDGYDYAKRASATLGEPVLAAAAGTATYVNSCPGCGNMIEIDHGNGYQTRYMHMQKDGLVVSVPNTPVHVNARQPIGKIGFSGNVIPPGMFGAHIHFMVVEDKNHDGNFDDNIPDGVTDPFGWEPDVKDPWETYRFTYKGTEHTGNKSSYLWSKSLDSGVQTTAPEKGGTISIPHLTVTIPDGFSDEALTTAVKPSIYKNADTSFTAVGNAFAISAYNQAHSLIKQFKKPFTVKFMFDKSALTPIQTATLGIYSSEDGYTWKLENTALDLTNGTATTQVNHMTYFALLAKRRDVIPPTTVISADGNRVTIKAQDNKGGSGTDYTVYAVDGGEQTAYTKSFVIQGKGSHTIMAYTVDKDGNVENLKKKTVTIRTNAHAGHKQLCDKYDI